jgi:penicillin-binding protein 2
VAENLQSRKNIIQALFILAALALVGKAMQLQIFDTDFQKKAGAAAVVRSPQFPARGLIYDRQGRLLIHNNPIYDLTVTYNQVKPNMDTSRFCELLGIDIQYFRDAINKDWRSGRFSKNIPFVFLSKVNAETYARFQENMFEFPGFQMVLRSIRGYPHSNAANVLGYIREVDPRDIEKYPDIYAPGDYIGAAGIEAYYENLLRGEKGVRYILKDNVGRNMGSFKHGSLDSAAISGKDIILAIDLELQAYAERLMKNKIGGIIAIEPNSGEILAMVTSVNYDPNLLTINQKRGEAFTKLNKDPLKPLFDRSVMAQYPPGSIFKSILGAIALQEGRWNVNRGVSCNGAYFLGGQRLVGCHGHPYCSNLETAIQHSCNAYFVTMYREMIDRYGFYSPNKGLDELNSYLRNFGLGQALGADIPGERNGNVPSSDFYDRVYAKSGGKWNSVWIRSNGIGQGEFLMTNLQIANLAAIIANKGFFITPHLLKGFNNTQDTIPQLFKQKKFVQVEPRFFEPIINGMEKVVTAGTAKSAFIPHIPICGKTGTAENPHGKDHSVFFGFAPKINPKIAFVVFVENSGFGGTYAAPIASLMVEKYLTDSISSPRLYLEKKMLDANLLQIPKSNP